MNVIVVILCCIRLYSDASKLPLLPEVKSKSIIIVFPFRDRHNHYRFHMRHLEARGKKNASFTFHIYVIEQDNNQPFNRAWLMNVGIAEAMKQYPSASCIVTHDVDLFAEQIGNYEWCDKPTQVCSELSCWNGKVPYHQSAGGVVQATPHDWKAINGYTNNAVGWGGEDDDLYHRFRMAGLLAQTKALRRPAKGKGKCRCLHDSDHTKREKDKSGYNQIVAQLDRMSRGSTEWKSDGLNSLIYAIQAQHVDTHGTHWLKV